MSQENTDLLYGIIYDFLEQNDILIVELATLFKKIEIEQLEVYMSHVIGGEDGEE